MIDLTERMNALTTISVVQAAKLLGIGKNKAYDLIARGEFPVPVRNIAGKQRVRLRDIEIYMGVIEPPADEPPAY